MTWLCEGLKDSMGGSRALESLKKYQVCSERLLSGVGWKSEVIRADALEQFQPNAFPSKYVFLTGVKHFASDFKKRKPRETSQGKFGQEVWRRQRERMHGQILLHPSSQEKEFFSLQMPTTLPLPTGISAESRVNFWEDFKVKTANLFRWIQQRCGIVQREEGHGQSSRKTGGSFVAMLRKGRMPGQKGKLLG